MKEKMQLSRSQKCFIEAILKLMQLKPYAEITVTEISEYAQYDRRTFYRYFKCKDDILYLYYATLLNEMATSMNQKGNLTPQSGFSSYFEFWFEHKEFLILLEKHNLMNQFGNKQEYLLYQYVGKKTTNNLPENLSDTSEFSQFSFFFTLGGLWYTLCFWVRNGMKQSPKQLTEHILNSFTEMANLIIWDK